MLSTGSLLPLYCFSIASPCPWEMLKKIFSPACSFFVIFHVIIIVRTTDPFETMLHRYRGLLFTLCRGFSHRSATAEDLLQEATVALWRCRERILPLPHVQQAAMVWRVARNAVVDSLRRTRRTEALPAGVDAVADDRSLLAELHERIALLDEPDRTIVSRQLEGYSYEEIAAEVGLSEKNVSVRLVRIKEKLKKQIVI